MSEIQVDACNDVDSSAVEDSDSDTWDNKNRRNRHSAYFFGKVRSFLQRTKNMKNVQVTDFFPDHKMFVDSAGVLM